jgi:hypothetical protein
MQQNAQTLENIKKEKLSINEIDCSKLDAEEIKKD